MKNTSKRSIFTLLFVSSLTIMVGAVIAPSLSGIIKHLDFDYSPSWLITLPSLGVVVFATFVGPLLNKFGKFKLLCFGLIPYALLGVAGAFITNDFLLIADRFLLGGATVVIQVTVTAYIAAMFTGQKRMQMIAWQGMAIELGGVVFLAIGGVLGEMNWQYPFYIYLLGIVCLGLVMKFLPKNDVIKNEEEVILSNKKDNKLKVKVIFYASLLSMMLFFIGYVTMPFYLPQNFNFSESDTGYFMAFISLIAIVTASQMPKMVHTIGNGKTVVLGFTFFMLGYLLLAYASSVIFLIITAVFIGIGFGFTIPLLNHMMIEVSTLENQGKNLGLFSMGVFGGQFLSTFIEYISHDYKLVYTVVSLLALVFGTILFYFFRKSA